jgi:hypothetical protein
MSLESKSKSPSKAGLPGQSMGPGTSESPTNPKFIPELFDHVAALTSLISPEQLDKYGQEQYMKLEQLMKTGNWKKIDHNQFGLLPEPLVENAKAMSLLVRRGLIFQEIEEHSHTQQILTDPEDRSGALIAYGKTQTLESELTEIYTILYPEIDISQNKERIIGVNRENIAAINFFIEHGDWESLDPNKIPELRYLNPHVLLRDQIAAAFVDRDGWVALLARAKETHVEQSEDKSDVGFPFIPENNTTTLQLYAKANIKRIDKQIEILAQQGIDLFKKEKAVASGSDTTNK